MGHLTRINYRLLRQRIDRISPGLPDSKNLYKILKILFTDEEAKLCSVMPLNFFTAKEIAKVWKKTEAKSKSILNVLAKKGLVCTNKRNNQQVYALAIPVFGFFEFSLMRTDGKFNRNELSKLYHEYINVEEEFIKRYAESDQRISRVYSPDDMLVDMASEVLPYERATCQIDSASCITVGDCFCRHKAQHLGLACKNPQEVCLSFNDMAEHLSTHGIARKISKDEAHSILNRCVKRGLVQIGENQKGKPMVICNCCGCCCDLLLGYKRMGANGIVSPSNYIAAIDVEGCSSCGRCFKKCPVDAISRVDGRFVVNKDVCLGCGVCARFCPTGACSMGKRSQEIFIPKNILEMFARIAISQGRVGSLLFQNQDHVVHKVLRNSVNYVAGLPALKRVLLDRRLMTPLFKVLEYTGAYARAKHLVE